VLGALAGQWGAPGATLISVAAGLRVGHPAGWCGPVSRGGARHAQWPALSRRRGAATGLFLVCAARVTAAQRASAEKASQRVGAKSVGSARKTPRCRDGALGAARPTSSCSRKLMAEARRETRAQGRRPAARRLAAARSTERGAARATARMQTRAPAGRGHLPEEARPRRRCGRVRGRGCAPTWRRAREAARVRGHELAAAPPRLIQRR